MPAENGTKPDPEKYKHYVMNHPLTYLVLLVLGTSLATFTFADDAKTWLREEMQYIVALHIAAGAHDEAEMYHLLQSRLHHKSEISAIERTIMDYESRIHSRTNDGSVSPSAQDRSQIRYYKRLISELKKRKHEHQADLEVVSARIEEVSKKIRSRTIPIAP